ncbi:MAG TPA: methyltransferase domain-containing protein [Oscillospiraceae bacterium]|nr:class I SAM-dependent methyltransferase [Oscillospiraceae bacterium]HNW03939.1 methyltransferase domain-containing protein [Oscillospiraceae bacterium]HPW00813.1 methyltransferase domain-containing protein [Oscillospiraceae bacterium]
MSDYSGFAPYYDRFTRDVDYPARARYFDAVIRRYAPDAKLVLDLACGTGTLTFELEKLGYDMIGVDGSWEMLSVATGKREEQKSEALFLCQEMRMLDLYGTVDAAVSALDSLNHILDEAELREVFRRVALFSNPGACFVFDVNTPYKHREILGNNSFVYEDDGALCVWRNGYDPQGDTVDITLDFFEHEDEHGLYRRSAAEFSERAWPPEELKSMLKESGFAVEAVYDEDSFLPLRPDSQRAVFVARKE